MKNRIFLIPSLLAAGFVPTKSDAAPVGIVSVKELKQVSIFERLRLHHLFTLAGHRSHSSHSSHSSHRSSSGGSYVAPRAVETYRAPAPTYVPSTPSPTYQAVPNTNTFPAAPSSPRAQPLKTLPGNSDRFRQIVIQVQTALSAYGYFSGVIDGKIGPDSKVALMKMQEAFNLKVTGTVTPEVLTSLSIVAN